VTKATFALALPFRLDQALTTGGCGPHATTPWLGCYPVHSFVDTTTPAVVESIEPAGIRPGVNSMFWTKIEGAQKYKVFFSTSDNDCKSGPGVIERESQFNFLLASGLQPETHYFIEVLPIGPNELCGARPAWVLVSSSSSIRRRYGHRSGSSLSNSRIYDYFGSVEPTWGGSRSINPTTIGCKYSPSMRLAIASRRRARSPLVPDACDWTTTGGRQLQRTVRILLRTSST